MPRVLPERLRAPFLNASTLYYGPPNVTTPGALTTTTDRLHFTPMFFVRPTPIDRIGCEVTTAVASSVIRLGIYLDTGVGQPGALVTDAGTVDSSTTGNKEITIAQIVSGLIWLAGVAQLGAPAVKGNQVALPSSGGPAANATGGQTAGYITSGITGALPNPAVPVGGITSSIRVTVRAT